MEKLMPITRNQAALRPKNHQAVPTRSSPEKKDKKQGRSDWNRGADGDGSEKSRRKKEAPEKEESKAGLVAVSTGIRTPLAAPNRSVVKQRARVKVKGTDDRTRSHLLFLSTKSGTRGNR